MGAVSPTCPSPIRTAVPALRRASTAFVGGLRAAEAVEGHVHAAAGDLPDGLDGVLLAGVHHVGCAELVAELELVVVDVDGDYAAGVEEPRALYDAKADAAASEDGDGHADPRGGHVDHRADPCGDAAAYEGGDVHGHPVGYGVAGLLGGDEGLAEDAELAHLADVGVSVVEPGGAVVLQGTGQDVGVAELGVAGPALVAVAAVGDEGEDAAVAGLHAGHALADLGDCPRALVAQDDGDRLDGRALHDVVVAGAQPRDLGLDAHLLGLGRVLPQVHDLEGAVYLRQDGGFQGASSVVSQGRGATLTI